MGFAQQDSGGSSGGHAGAGLAAAFAAHCGGGFEPLFLRNPLPMWLYDPPGGRFVEVNAAAQRLYGYSREQFLALSPPQLAADGGAAAAPGPAPGAGGGRSCRHRRRDGTPLSVDLHEQPLQLEGRPLLLCIAQDLTAHRALEETLAADREFLKAVLDTVGDGIGACDANGELTTFNPAAQRLLGLPEDLRQPRQWRDWYDFYEADGSAPLPPQRLPLYRAVKGEKLSEVELLVVPRGRPPCRVLVSAAPIVSGSGRRLGGVAVLRDVTGQRRAEQALARLRRISTVLSSINTLIVRARDRRQLFEEACRITVEEGGFRCGWIEMRDERGRMQPVAVCGLDGAACMELLAPALRAAPAQGHARSLICNDLAADPALAPWREVALARGVRAVAGLPLRVGGKVVGCFGLCSDQAGVFDGEEVKLLDELAGDISYSMEFITREEALDYIAYYDPVTRLANRRLFLERLSRSMDSAREGRSMLAVLLLDLERFKAVNDTFGRAAGDELLKLVGERLVPVARGAAQLARIGGDLFAIEVPGLARPAELGRILEETLAEHLRPPFLLEGREVHLGARVGAAVFPDDGEDAESLLRNAEAALKKAKDRGDRYLFYTREMSAAISERQSLAVGMRRALERHEFVLHYQPKVSLRGGEICGCEALIRWNSPELGLVPPARFIPLLEETGLIVEVGRRAIAEAAKEYRRLLGAGLKPPPIAVNVSPLQLKQPDFVEMVRGAVSTASGDITPIELEVTESMLMGDLDATIAKLAAIRALGVGVAIDDFGTGYSSLAYLSRLPVNAVKIDRSFIVSMTDDADTMSIVSTIIALAHSMDLQVIAEGVDSEEQLKFLRLLKCDQIQGYLFSRPLAADAFAVLLRRSQPWLEVKPAA